MESCYNCKSDSLAETSDGVTCTDDCARCQNIPLFKHIQQHQTFSNDVTSVDSCSPSILEELKHSLKNMYLKNLFKTSEIINDMYLLVFFIFC